MEGGATIRKDPVEEDCGLFVACTGSATRGGDDASDGAAGLGWEHPAEPRNNAAKAGTDGTAGAQGLAGDTGTWQEENHAQTT